MFSQIQRLLIVREIALMFVGQITKIILVKIYPFLIILKILVITIISIKINLVENSENEIKNILKFCNLEWDPNCLNHEKNKKTIKTASATQARNRINKSGLKTYEPFKKYLDEISRILNS